MEIPGSVQEKKCQSSESKENGSLSFNLFVQTGKKWLMPEGSILTECHHKMFLSSKIIIMPKFGHSALEEFYLKSYNLWKCHKKRPTTVHYKVCPLGLKRPPKKKKKMHEASREFCVQMKEGMMGWQLQMSVLSLWKDHAKKKQMTQWKAAIFDWHLLMVSSPPPTVWGVLQTVGGIVLRLVSAVKSELVSIGPSRSQL